MPKKSHVTLAQLIKRATELHPEFKSRFSWRPAFEYATEAAFNQFDVRKAARKTLRMAMAVPMSGPDRVRTEIATDHDIERNVRILYEFGVEIDGGFDEIFRQYQVVDFKERMRLRHKYGAFIGKSGGERNAKRLEQEKTPEHSHKPQGLSFGYY